MSEPAKFLFDECIGRPMMESLRTLVLTEAKFVHITSFFSQGTKDRDWVPKLAVEPGWVVITADGGRQSKRDDKLPDICTAHRITHLVLSSSLHAKKATEKVSAIAAMWGKIEPLSLVPTGSRFRLRYKEVRGSSGVMLVLEDITPSPLDQQPVTPPNPDATPDPSNPT